MSPLATYIGNLPSIACINTDMVALETHDLSLRYNNAFVVETKATIVCETFLFDMHNSKVGCKLFSLCNFIMI